MDQGEVEYVKMTDDDVDEREERSVDVDSVTNDG